MNENEFFGMPSSITEESIVNLPIKFPSDAEVIVEEVARFRTLPPISRAHSIRGLIAIGARMLKHSPMAEFANAHAEQQKELSKRSVKEFIKRHGC